MIEIYDDTDESTVPFDLRWSRTLILLSIAVCLIIAVLASFGNESFFHIPNSYGVIVFMLSGAISIGLYFWMYNSQKYPSLFASLSILLLGISSFLTGFNINLGIGILSLSLVYITIYIYAISMYNIDNPDI